MIRSLVGIIGFGLISLTSCMDIEASQHLDRIAELNQTVDSVETVFNEHKMDSIGAISLNAYTIENRVKRNYQADTIDMELGRKMDAFKLMRKSLKSLGTAQSSIPVSIEEERTKLKELKNDIENGDGEREKYAEYVAFEENKVDQLRVLLKDYVTTKESVVSTYKELHDELNNFSLSLLEQ